MNNKYNEDFNSALKIYEKDFPHKDLIKFLKTGSVAQKQAAVLKLDKINTPEEAEIFISNLTGCDGKIREAVSFRLKEFLPQNPEFYLKFSSIFLDAIIDINGNICRNTIEALKSLLPYKDFAKNFTIALTEKTLALAGKVKDFDIQEGKYKINKEIFKLYWYLETLSAFLDYANGLEEILSITSCINEYTIREKTAKILSKIPDKFPNIKEKLQNDANYYVRRF